MENRPGGAVELSADGGEEWKPLGKVTRAATATAPATTVIGVVPAGTVAGVGPEHLLLRVPGPKGELRSLRILAKGEAGNVAAVSTDLPTRSALFRSLAPPVGSRVLLEREERAAALPAGWVPKPGDRLLVRVLSPDYTEPPSIVIENKEDGEVVLAATGGVPRVLARVKQPLRGIGRYSGTERAGRGSVVCWTPTAVMVSTSGLARRLDADGNAAEERGGFVVQPAEPRLMGATHQPSQLLIEAVPEGDAKPAISRFFGLAAPLTTGDPLDEAPTRVDVRIDEGDWEPLPDLRGAINEENLNAAMQQALGEGRTVKAGITHLRFTFGRPREANLRRRLLLATTQAADAPQRGRVTISANVMGEGVQFVGFFLNGRQAKLSNIPPYAWDWDTRTVPNGEHLIEIRGLDSRGVIVSSVLTRVLVDN